MCDSSVIGSSSGSLCEDCRKPGDEATRSSVNSVSFGKYGIDRSGDIYVFVRSKRDAMNGGWWLVGSASIGNIASMSTHYDTSLPVM